MGSGMGAGGMHLLPDGLRIAWIAIYAVIFVLHLRHASGMGGQHRAWHGGHLLMAAGMIYMFLPSGILTIPTMVGVVVFGLSALAIAGWIVYATINRRPLDVLWVIQMLSMLGMTYMFAVPLVAVAPLTYLCTVYFATEMGCWALGAFDRPQGPQQVIPAVVGGGASALRAEARPLAGAGSLEMRVTLSLMAAGMAYMFLAMQVGM